MFTVAANNDVALMKEPNTRLDDGHILYDIPSFHETKLSQMMELCKKRIAQPCGTRRHKVFNGTRRSKILVQVFEMKRASGAVTSFIGESAAMKPGAPTHGHISRSGYARRLDGFVDGHRPSVELFESRRTWRHKGGVSEEVQFAIAERSVLYFPWEGVTDARRNPKRQSSIARRIESVRETEEGFDILDGETWVMIASEEAARMIRNGTATLRHADADQVSSSN